MQILTMTATWKRHLISIAGCTALAACGPDEDTVATDTTERAHSNWCDPPNPPDTYDFYPGTGTYTSGSAATYPWAGDDFESYADGETIECSSNKSLRTHLETTSGCLTAEHPAPTYKRGYMVDEARVLAQGLHGGTATSNRVKWTAQINELRFWVASTYAPGSGEPSTQGPSLFARYRTENDLYVATARFDTDE